MDSEKTDTGYATLSAGLVMKCPRCGDTLPLLHPHIVVERYDEDENMICEQCYEKLCSGS